MKRLLVMGLALVLVMAFAAPAFAVNGSGGAGKGFGQHHADHARDMQGFTGTENPGVMHRGFSGWAEHHE
ncbi:hypothetical protein EG835_07885 [bacterium]|nr:hypothetical protein [bacterium]